LHNQIPTSLVVENVINSLGRGKNGGRRWGTNSKSVVAQGNNVGFLRFTQ